MIKDNCKHIPMHLLAQMIENNGQTSSGQEYDMTALLDRRNELAERQTDAMFSDYMAQLSEQAAYYVSAAKAVISKAIETMRANSARFFKFKYFKAAKALQITLCGQSFVFFKPAMPRKLQKTLRTIRYCFPTFHWRTMYDCDSGGRAYFGQLEFHWIGHNFNWKSYGDGPDRITKLSLYRGIVLTLKNQTTSGSY
jgi:hypothetical protein